MKRAYLLAGLLAISIMSIGPAAYGQSSTVDADGFYLTKTVSDTDIHSGLTFDYTIEFSIPDGATGVTIADDLPSGLICVGVDYSALSSEFSVITEPAVGSLCTPLEIQASGPFTGYCHGSVIIQVMFPNGTTCNGTTVRNRATLEYTSDTGAPASISTDFVETTAIAIDPWTYSVYPLGPYSGDPLCPKENAAEEITYRYRIKRQPGAFGQMNLTDVSVEDQFPVDAQIINVVTDQWPAVGAIGSISYPPPNGIRWDIPLLDVNTIANYVVMDVTVKYPYGTSFPYGSSITTNATTLYGDLPPGPLCGPVAKPGPSTCVKRVQAIGKVKLFASSMQPGCKGTYEIIVSNYTGGTLNPCELIITDHPSANITLDPDGLFDDWSTYSPCPSGTNSYPSIQNAYPITPNGIGYMDGNNLKIVNTQALAHGEHIVFYVDFTISSAANPGDIVANTLTAVANGTPIGNPVIKEFTVVQPEAELCLYKEVCNKQPVYAPGDNLTYRLRIRNIGGMDIVNPVVKDILNPMVFSYVPNSARFYTDMYPNPQCGIADDPSLQGSVVAYDAATGKLVFTFNGIPQSCADASITNCSFGGLAIPYYYIEFDVEIKKDAVIGNIPNEFTVDEGLPHGAVSNPEFILISAPIGSLTPVKSVPSYAAPGASIPVSLTFQNETGCVAIRDLSMVDKLPLPGDNMHLPNCSPRASTVDLQYDGGMNVTYTDQGSTSSPATVEAHALDNGDYGATINAYPPSGPPLIWNACPGPTATWIPLSSGANNLGLHVSNPEAVAADEVITAKFNLKVPSGAADGDIACNSFVVTGTYLKLIDGVLTVMPTVPTESEIACVTIDDGTSAPCPDPVITDLGDCLYEFSIENINPEGVAIDDVHLFIVNSDDLKHLEPVDIPGGWYMPNLTWQYQEFYDRIDLFASGGYNGGNAIPHGQTFSGLTFQLSPKCAGDVTIGWITTTHDPAASDTLVCSGEFTLNCNGSCMTPPSDMLGWYPFDEAQGTSIATDITPMPHSGNYVGNPTAISGVVDNAVQFPTELDYIQVSSSILPSPYLGTNSFSIDAWVKLDGDQPGFHTIAYRHDGTKGFSFVRIASGVELILWDGTNYRRTSAYDQFMIPYGVWRHCAAVVERSATETTVSVYIDGELMETRTYADPNEFIASTDLDVDAPLYIGKEAPEVYGHYGLNGAVDELEIFSRAITADEIMDLYMAGKCGKCKPTYTSEICGLKYNDLNGNGQQDPGEPGMEGWTIELTDCNGTVLQSVVTDANGEYCFENVVAGDYCINEVLQTGWTQTEPAGGTGYTLNVPEGEDFSDIVFGNVEDPCECESELQEISTPPGIPNQDVCCYKLRVQNPEDVNEVKLEILNPVSGAKIEYVGQPASWLATFLPNTSFTATSDDATNDWDQCTWYEVPFCVSYSSGTQIELYWETRNGSGLVCSGTEYLDCTELAFCPENVIQDGDFTNNPAFWSFYKAGANPGPDFSPSTPTGAEGSDGVVGMWGRTNKGEGIYQMIAPGTTYKITAWMRWLDSDDLGGTDIYCNVHYSTSEPLQRTDLTPLTLIGTSQSTSSTSWVQATWNGGTSELYWTAPSSGPLYICFNLQNDGAHDLASSYGHFDRICITPVDPTSEICGLKYNDLNGNGQQDTDEPGMDGWTIELTDCNGSVLSSAVTDTNGTYCFEDVLAGDYCINEVQLPGWMQTEPAGGDGYTLSVTEGDDFSDIDFGNRQENVFCPDNILDDGDFIEPVGITPWETYNAPQSLNPADFYPTGNGAEGSLGTCGMWGYGSAGEGIYQAVTIADPGTYRIEAYWRLLNPSNTTGTDLWCNVKYGLSAPTNHTSGTLIGTSETRTLDDADWADWKKILWPTNEYILWEVTTPGTYYLAFNLQNGGMSAAASSAGQLDRICVKYIGPINSSQRSPSPHAFELLNFFPNPATGITTINYSLGTSMKITLELHDALGKRVALIEEGVKNPGLQTTQLNTNILPSGTYYLRLSSATETKTRKMQIVK
ncbi:MAG: hypothetical protein CL946_07965 [Ectothiorhodospiraceae bacterium]|nr:hypothetical protein [Ectothiorhodospiraceae bacterium]